MNQMTGTPVVVEHRFEPAAHEPVANLKHRANTVLAVVLVAVVALAPIPLGSNRPFFWAVWAGLLGVVGAAYLVVLVGKGEPLRFAPSRLWLHALLLVALGAMLAIQLLPVIPTDFTTALGDVVSSPALSIAPGVTGLILLQLATYGLFFMLTLQVAVNRRRARAMATALLIVVTAHAAYGLIALTMMDDALLFFEKWAYAGVATGTFVNRNSFATFLAFGLVLGVTLAGREYVQAKARPGARLLRSAMPLFLACTALILAALLATGSRMGLIAALLGAGCAAALSLGKRPAEQRLRVGWIAIAVLPVLAAVVILILYGATTIDRLGSLENDANVRGDLYAQVIDMIAARPLLGYGGGSFELAFPLFHQLPVSPDMIWDRAHSTYLTLWAELGLVAGSIPLLIVALLAAEALWLYLNRRGDWATPVAALCVTLVAAVHSLVDFSLEMQANVLLFLAILALAIARPKGRVSTDAEPDLG